MGPGQLTVEPRDRIGAGVIVLAAAGAGAAVADHFNSLAALPAAVAHASPTLAGLAAAAAGTRLILRGWPRRRGRSVHCSACGYQRDDRGPLIPACPECGGPWRWLGRFRTGERHTDPGAIALGLTLFLLASAAAMAT